MKPEELFMAIGAVEENRLARSELRMFSDEKQEDRKMKPTRLIRHFLAAAVIVSMLAVTAYAVTGFLIYDNPQDMIAAIFGDKTGFDHGEYTEIPDPERPESLLAAQPEFDRVEADPTVVAEDIAPYVSLVGQSIEFHGMKLTVDSFVYDNATKCGIVTYMLENGPEYYLQYDGQVSYMGRPNPVKSSRDGYSYIIQEKTTDNVLAAAYYFYYNDRSDKDGFYFALQDGMTVEEHQKQSADAAEAVREKYTTEEMIQWAKEYMGEEAFQTSVKESGQTAEDVAFEAARTYQIIEWSEGYEDTSAEKISFDCAESRELKHIALKNKGITVSPVSLLLDLEKLELLHENEKPVNSDLIDTIEIRFVGGDSYQVIGGNVSNVVFELNTTADGTMESDYTVFVMMLNRVIDIDNVAAVILNGTEFVVE